MKKRTLWLLGALNMIGPFTYDAYLGALPQITRDLHTTTAATQATIVANLVGMTVGMMLGGSISDTIGRRKPVLVAVAFYVVVSLAIVQVNSVDWFIALRLLQGLAGGAMVSVSQAVVRDLTEGKSSAKVFSVLLLIKSIGPILAPLVGAFLLLFGDWRLIFLFLALLGVIFLVWSFTTLKDSLPDELKISLTFKGVIGGWGSVFSDRLFLASGITSFLNTFALFAYFSTATFALQADFGLTPFQFGWFMVVNGCALILFRSINTRLLNKLSFYTVYRIGMAVGMASAIVLSIYALTQNSFILFSAGLFLMTGSLGFLVPNALTLALTNHKNNAGAAAGLSGFIGAVAGFISASLAGHLIGDSSVGLAIYIAIPMALAGISLLLFGKHDSLAH